MERAQYCGWFTENIYPLARSYANKNPIEGVEFDDYVQELVAKAWEKVDAFDPSKSTLTTFAFLWFRNVKWRLTDAMVSRTKYMSWCDVEDSDGNVRNACDDAVSCDDLSGEYSAAEELSMVSPIAASVINGDSIRAVAKAFGMSAEEVSKTLAEDVRYLKEALEAEA